jgi:hypothetical protein
LSHAVPEKKGTSIGTLDPWQWDTARIVFIGMDATKKSPIWGMRRSSLIAIVCVAMNYQM